MARWLRLLCLAWGIAGCSLTSQPPNSPSTVEPTASPQTAPSSPASTGALQSPTASSFHYFTLRINGQLVSLSGMPQMFSTATGGTALASTVYGEGGSGPDPVRSPGSDQLFVTLYGGNVLSEGATLSNLSSAVVMLISSERFGQSAISLPDPTTGKPPVSIRYSVTEGHAIGHIEATIQGQAVVLDFDFPSSGPIRNGGGCVPSPADVPTGTLTGVVFDVADHPILNASVEAKSLSPSEPFDTEVSNAENGYSVRGVPLGIPLLVTAQAPGYAPVSRTVKVEEPPLSLRGPCGEESEVPNSTVNFGGPASLADPESPGDALVAEAEASDMTNASATASP